MGKRRSRRRTRTDDKSEKSDDWLARTVARSAALMAGLPRVASPALEPRTEDLTPVDTPTSVEPSRSHTLLLSALDEQQCDDERDARLRSRGLRVIADAEYLKLTREILELKTMNRVLEERCVHLRSEMVSVTGHANRFLRGIGFSPEATRDDAMQREVTERLLKERSRLFEKVARLTDERASIEEKLDREVGLRQRIVEMARCVEEERIQAVTAHEAEIAHLKRELRRETSSPGLPRPPILDATAAQAVERLDEELKSKMRTIKEQAATLAKRDKAVKKLEERVARQTQQLEHLNWSLSETQREADEARRDASHLAQYKRTSDQLTSELSSARRQLAEATAAAAKAYDWQCAYQSIARLQGQLASAELPLPPTPPEAADVANDWRRQDLPDIYLASELDDSVQESTACLHKRLESLADCCQDLQLRLEESELARRQLHRESQAISATSRTDSDECVLLDLSADLPETHDAAGDARLHREVTELRMIVHHLVKKYALSKEEVFVVPAPRPKGLLSSLLTPRTPQVEPPEWERLYRELQVENIRLKVDMKSLAEQLLA